VRENARPWETDPIDQPGQKRPTGKTQKHQRGGWPPRTLPGREAVEGHLAIMAEELNGEKK